VETLRDKISALSRELANAQQEYAASSAHTRGSAEDGVDTSPEVQVLRRELGETKAALDAQMTMVRFSVDSLLQSARTALAR
jgi:predicted  nucleic acid-binding Zn-ribbon protein